MSAWTVNMVCERPPAGRFAPRLSPFVRGTLTCFVAALMKPVAVSPLRRGTAVERSDRQGVAHKTCFDFCYPNAIPREAKITASHNAYDSADAGFTRVSARSNSIFT